jgi:hypothetical protein
MKLGTEAIIAKGMMSMFKMKTYPYWTEGWGKWIQEQILGGPLPSLVTAVPTNCALKQL